MDRHRAADRLGRAATGFERGVAGESAVLFVAVDGDTVVGHVALYVAGGRADLGMAITDGYRGAGLGRRLLDAGLEWARTAGAHKVVLEAWPHNAAAIGLYERVGFEYEGRHRRHWRRNDGSLWDSIVMGLVLDETAPGCPYD